MNGHPPPAPPGAAAGPRAGAPTPYPVAARELLRATLLDGVRELLRTKPWAEITMAEVARAAGVSRQTLYKELGSRSELAQAFVLREADLFLAAVEDAVRENRHDPVTALSAAFDVFLTAAADDPLVRTIVAGDGADELLVLLTTQGTPVLERTTARLAALIGESWPELGGADAVLVSECVVRLAISYAALPASPSGLTGRTVGDLLGPYIERVRSR